MLYRVELEKFLERLSIPDKGRDRVREAQWVVPTREVQSRMGNVITRCGSRRITQVISSESQVVESSNMEKMRSFRVEVTMPDLMVLDNGKEFHSEAMRRVCKLYGCDL